MLKKKLKKKKKRLKEEVSLWEESRRSSDGQNDEPDAVEPPSKRNAADNGKISKTGAGMWAPTWARPTLCFECAGIEWFFFPPNPATVVVWDSQVKDGYKRSQAPATDASQSADVQTRAAPAAWDGKKTSGVVEELLRNASDKAYGANGEMLRPLKVSSVAARQVAHLQHSSDLYAFKGDFLVPSSPQLGWGGLCYQ